MSEAPSFSYAIDTSRLDGQQLPDGDRIELSDIGQAANPSHVGFELEIKKDMWWKGLVLFGKNNANDWNEVVAGDWGNLQNPNYAKKSVEIPFSDIESKFTALSKAKAFGVHSNVYHVVDAATALKPGRKYKINWTQD
jgi:hypothetical protein